MCHVVWGPVIMRGVPFNKNTLIHKTRTNRRFVHELSADETAEMLIRHAALKKLTKIHHDAA